jgi:MYXO-CTERM domain-containing protein
MYAIAVGGGHRFYTAGRDGHFLSHSFADKTAITPIAYEVIGGDVLYVAPQDNFLFLGRQLDIAKVDISDEEVPVLAGEGSLGIENPDHGQVTPMGNLVFVGNDHGTGSAFFCHQIGPDTIPLEAQTFYPEDGATVPVDTRITIVFSDFVDLETLSSDSVAIRPVGGEPLEGIFTYQFNQLSFSPHEPLEAETDYEIFLLGDGLRDVMGNGLPEDVTVTFTTERVVTVPEPDPPTMNEGGAGGSEGGEEPEDTSDSTTDSGGCSCSSGAGAPTAGGIGWGLLVALFAWARRRPKWL